MYFKIIATTTFGLEAVVKRELQDLGYENIKVTDGKVEIEGNEEDIANLNINLRCAERVLIKFGEFKALTFDELFERTKALPWENIIPENGEFPVDGKSLKSKLFSISDSQAIVKKAIVERLKSVYKIDWFEENGPKYKIEVSLLKDIATLTIDTSGEGLHKRGYRDRAGDAPLKETLAAAMIKLSYWNPDRTLYDPFCGSGTILIEAAMIGKNIAPGIDREFISQEWPIIGKDIYKKHRKIALGKIDHKVKLHLLGSDTDKRSILRARDNAENIGVNEDIQFFMKDMRDVDLLDNYGVVITNPPYGERMGEQKEIEKLYRDLGKKFKDFPTWSVYLITNNEKFEKLYGKKADRKRKLYNGRIKVDYYQFYGPRPQR
ncbi:THUMP domain-containing class I SAM-dependent RNA methyltransferase [Miniphocaeibacter halophilus]|uniref:Class I SAM-dependent RNA methyltransferase n=1 Tax=Miniphocaeibacter halophilus TaxID=2931922 RepID=A0AC61MYI4_9FIRM|nr:class I SAM-dependent RNA methyltransferase [Miniphocaeibacter halophilus]QQK08186.1 class I SAM-dependent RNA methyltransferase [Miniphocaeibacter halophilus]